MKDALKLVTPQDVATDLNVTLGILRRWIWKLDIEPVKYEKRTYETKKGGRRVGLQSYYSPSQVTALKRAMGKS